MFGIPGKQAVSITPAAARQISRLMQAKGSAGLRIGDMLAGSQSIFPIIRTRTERFTSFPAS